ncbi:MAG: 50S ribosomal protein L9 [Chloroflexi bacterium]|nr:50S ribosomal protein L9 [Chloroflexota bacterium]
MKVLLTQDVKGLGAAGQVKEVADGYARNYLIPRGLATPATSEALRQVEARKAAAAKRMAEDERRARGRAEQMAAEPLVIHAHAGETGRLYGSVTAADIAEALERRLGQPVDKRRVELQEPIRRLGTHRVPVKLPHNVVATITVVVRPAGGS